jgi:hypothetical protein
MVKLLYSALYTQPQPGQEPVALTASSELSSFGYFQRGRCARSPATRHLAPLDARAAGETDAR